MCMRVSVSCPVCTGAAMERGDSPEELGRAFDDRVTALVTHERVASVRCRVGHPFVVVVADPTHALVFERGLQRLADGDLRDAVLDAYTAMEMYMPTVPVRARYDRDRSLMPKDILRLRKELKFITGDANRALGAALAVASVVSNKPPPVFDTTVSKLRNDAVHAGKYPSKRKTKPSRSKSR
jgi:hypothetical protein